MTHPYVYIPDELKQDEETLQSIEKFCANMPQAQKEQQEATIAGLAYELVTKDLALQTLEATQADVIYQLMFKGVL